MPDQPNGNVIRERIDQLRHKLRGTETAMQFLAEKGQRNNEQIRVHDEQFREIDRRLDDIEEKAMRVPILEERLETLADGYRSARTAFYAAAVALFGLIATILLQGGGA